MRKRFCAQTHTNIHAKLNLRRARDDVQFLANIFQPLTLSKKTISLAAKLVAYNDDEEDTLKKKSAEWCNY